MADSLDVYARRTFDTDWEELSREAVLDRALAIGVAESLDDAPPAGESIASGRG